MLLISNVLKGCLAKCNSSHFTLWVSHRCHLLCHGEVDGVKTSGVIVLTLKARFDLYNTHRPIFRCLNIDFVVFRFILSMNYVLCDDIWSTLNPIVVGSIHLLKTTG